MDQAIGCGCILIKSPSTLFVQEEENNIKQRSKKNQTNSKQRHLLFGVSKGTRGGRADLHEINNVTLVVGTGVTTTARRAIIIIRTAIAPRLVASPVALLEVGMELGILEVFLLNTRIQPFLVFLVVPHI